MSPARRPASGGLGRGGRLDERAQALAPLGLGAPALGPPLDLLHAALLLLQLPLYVQVLLAEARGEARLGQAVLEDVRLLAGLVPALAAFLQLPLELLEPLLVLPDLARGLLQLGEAAIDLRPALRELR